MAMRARRSCLTVPGHDERKLRKAADVAADEVILDLEDAVPPARKDEARACVERALRDLEWRAPTVALRVNRGSAEDLELARTARPDVVVVPEVESRDEVEGLPAPAEAQIETARGLLECERIAAARGLEALVLGPGDLAASLGVHALLRVLVAARASGVAAVDGPYVRLDDAEGLRGSAVRSRDLGYDGKWCIHPSQIEICNEVYTPTQAEVERARRLLAVEGADRIDAEMVDAATRRMAEALLARLPPTERRE